MNKNNNDAPKKQKDKINTKVYTYYTAKEKLQISIEDSGVTEELIAILRELDHEANNEDRKHDSHKQFENDLFEDLELIDTTQLKALTTNSKFSTIEIELIKNEQARILHDAISELNAKQKHVIYGVYFYDKTIREIGQEFETNISYVIKVKKSAMKKLKKSILKNAKF